ncbi:ribosome small subunit-dependent GTPase A [Rubrivirga sp. IMCC45206]|uniref:ribosome small subunit-dependent GTPase A n=1 Tax=Rubrivirga sp. IMCC45206 TaxID=3391614 RepID=UPI0039901E44
MSETDDRPDAPDDAPPREPVRGLVLRSTGSWYDIRTDDGDDVRARIRGRFRLDALEIDETNPIAVGDRVRLTIGDDGSGFITDIEPRETQLSRRAAGKRGAVREHVIVANIDRAWVVQSVYEPKVNPGFVDRFLVAAETRHIPAGIVMNKTDLMEDSPRAQEAVAFWQELYEGLGYPVILTSVVTGRGIDTFRAALADRVSVVSGPSGVGKSSLLNAIEPGLRLATSEISEKTQKGRHTTTFATLLEAGGGWVADTPGIREFGLWDMAPEELGGYFVEFLDYIPDCRFPDCTHAHEPGCAVQSAVDEGEITPERYGSYLAMLETVIESHRLTKEARWRTLGRPDDPDDPFVDAEERTYNNPDGRAPGEG